MRDSPHGTFCIGGTAYSNCDAQYEDVSTFFYNNWSVANTAIATVDYYGTHTGVSVGSTTSSTTARMPKYFRFTCPIDGFTASGTVNVTPTVSISGPAYVPLRTGSSTGPNSMTLTATGKPDGGAYTWSTSSTNVSLSNTSSPTVTVTASAASTSIGDTPITVKYVLNGDTNCANPDNCANSTGNITVSKPTSLQLVTDSNNPTGHTCNASAGSNTCTQSKFTGSGSYASYVRTRTYHVMDQFSPPRWISGYAMDIQESYSPPSGQCASSVITQPPSAGDTATDCFYFCSATCQSGGSCNVSATQTVTVNGFQIATESVNWTCSSVSVQP